MGNEQSLINELKVSQTEQRARERQKRDELNTANRKLNDVKISRNGPRVNLQVERSDVFRTGISYIKDPTSERCPLNVIFVTHGKEEETVNLGGPNREFFTLFLEEFAKGTTPEMELFEKNGSVLLPYNNRIALQSDRFFYFGKTVVISILSDGPGFPYFPPYIFSYLCGREFTHELCVNFINNANLRIFIDSILSADTQCILDEIVSDDRNMFLDYCEWPQRQRITMDSRQHLVQSLLEWDLVSRRKEALDQIKKGLSTLGFLSILVEHPEFETFFLCRNKRQTTASYIRNEVSLKVKRLVPRDEKESLVKKCTLELLQDLNDKEASNLFQFITGLDDVLFSDDFMINVTFNRNEPGIRFPKAITCLSMLQLPLGVDSKLSLYTGFDKAVTLGKIGFSD